MEYWGPCLTTTWNIETSSCWGVNMWKNTIDFLRYPLICSHWSSLDYHECKSVIQYLFCSYINVDCVFGHGRFLKIAKYHCIHIALSHTSMTDEDNIMAWEQKYVTCLDENFFPGPFQMVSYFLLFEVFSTSHCVLRIVMGQNKPSRNLICFYTRNQVSKICDASVTCHLFDPCCNMHLTSTWHCNHSVTVWGAWCYDQNSYKVTIIIGTGNTSW
jgi:hypothetical protein